MTFNKKDKEIILSLYGGDEKTFNEDLPQIEEAADCTTYEVMRNGDEKGKKITRTGAIRLLGRDAWLSGLVRSAFHWTACRILDERRVVYFDSHELFK